MRTTTLGRTGLDVSIAGLGCGGHSRLGTAYGKDNAHAASIVKLAVELGVNLIDTARTYGTEPAVALALRDLDRDKLILSTKAGLWPKDKGGPLVDADEFEARLNQSLQNLGVETIDLYHVHGLLHDQIDHLLDHIMPVLHRAKTAGKIRFLAVSEVFQRDPAHRTLPELMQRCDDFDVMMVGHNLLNPSARRNVFPQTIKHNVGVEVMFAVRNALSNPDHLRKTVAELIEQGKVDAGAVDANDPLGFLVDDETPSVMDAAYRFCAHEPGCHTILFGTGNADHLRDNIASLNRPPLSQAKRDQLEAIFGAVDSVSGN
ncbi:MAG: aldo/keto reductase [Phycisphaerales bacterium JB063]